MDVSWTIQKAECRRIDAFDLWCWRRCLRVPWTAKRYNQAILKRSVLSVHWKDLCWSWNSNTLAIWCEELIHLKRPWCWERLKVGGEGEEDEMAGRHHWLDGHMSLSKPHVLVMDREAWQCFSPLGHIGSQRVWHDWATELNWTTGRWHLVISLKQNQHLSCFFVPSLSFLFPPLPYWIWYI